jgi:hypothetical protein
MQTLHGKPVHSVQVMLADPEFLCTKIGESWNKRTKNEQPKNISILTSAN